MDSIDYDKVREIIETADRAYYGREACHFERRIPPTGQIDDVFGRVCTPETRVLDIGCGNGRTLLRNAAGFAEGVGLDDDERMVSLAERNRTEAGVKNVRFVHDWADKLPFEKESFDFIFSERGPLAGSDVNTFNAVRALRPGGTILAECPGPLGNREAGYIFAPDQVPLKETVHGEMLEGLSAVLRRNGIEVQFAGSYIEEWVFADLYEWVKYHMSCWDYYGDRRFETWPLPENVQHGIDRFLVMTADDQGRIHITNQRLWVGGKRSGEGRA